MAALIALALAAPAGAAPPQTGVLAPGRTLGGLALGASPRQVRSAWGGSFGRCSGCATPTWYYDYRPFEPQGAGVQFRDGRAVALFTLWSPPGWRTTRGLRLGDNALRATEVYGALLRTECGRYAALTLRRGRVVTSIYLLDGKVWGFGLSRPSVPVCR